MTSAAAASFAKARRGHVVVEDKRLASCAAVRPAESIGKPEVVGVAPARDRTLRIWPSVASGQACVVGRRLERKEDRPRDRGDRRRRRVLTIGLVSRSSAGLRFGLGEAHGPARDDDAQRPERGRASATVAQVDRHQVRQLTVRGIGRVMTFQYAASFAVRSTKDRPGRPTQTGRQPHGWPKDDVQSAGAGAPRGSSAGVERRHSRAGRAGLGESRRHRVGRAPRRHVSFPARLRPSPGTSCPASGGRSRHLLVRRPGLLAVVEIATRCPVAC